MEKGSTPVLAYNGTWFEHFLPQAFDFPRASLNEKVDGLIFIILPNANTKHIQRSGINYKGSKAERV